MSDEKNQTPGSVEEPRGASRQQVFSALAR